jgi:nicotinate-nucleotide adenylyltransferase
MFNPPHLGHIELARAALRELGLRRVLLVPTAIPPHKPAIMDPGAEHRAQMCRLACAREPRIEVCALELRRPGPSYTVDTLRSIHANHPDVELTLILGADMAATLGRWREPGAILKLASVAVAERPGTSREQVLAALGTSRRIDFLAMEPSDLSSSQVRRTLTAGRPIASVVGPDVAAYIEEHELYGRHPAAGASEVRRA